MPTCTTSVTALSARPAASVSIFARAAVAAAAAASAAGLWPAPPRRAMCSAASRPASAAIASRADQARSSMRWRAKLAWIGPTVSDIARARPCAAASACREWPRSRSACPRISRQCRSLSMSGIVELQIVDEPGAAQAGRHPGQQAGLAGSAWPRQVGAADLGVIDLEAGRLEPLARLVLDAGQRQALPGGIAHEAQGFVD